MPLPTYFEPVSFFECDFHTEKGKIFICGIFKYCQIYLIFQGTMTLWEIFVVAWDV